MMPAAPTIEDVRTFWPAPNIYDGISLPGLLREIQLFALETFDRLDLNGNGFISAQELDQALRFSQLNGREKNYVQYLLVNIEIIGRAFDDHDDINPCGISRHDLEGISRQDLISYFARM